MSVLPPEADIRQRIEHVCFVPIGPDRQVTLSAAHTELDLPVTALVAIAVAGLVTWLVLLLVSRVAAKARRAGPHGHGHEIHRAARAVMGIQFALTGLRKFGT